jgi:hypothetical protein
MIHLPLSVRLKWFRLRSAALKSKPRPKRPDLDALMIDPSKNTLLVFEAHLAEDQREHILHQLRLWLESDQPIAILEGVGPVLKVTDG